MGGFTASTSLSPCDRRATELLGPGAQGHPSSEAVHERVCCMMYVVWPGGGVEKTTTHVGREKAAHAHTHNRREATRTAGRDTHNTHNDNPHTW